jgi:N-acetyl-anhydromuramyl-L-alanine amidase AmpD
MRARHALAMMPLIGASAMAQPPFDLDLLNSNFCNAYWELSPNVDDRPLGVDVDTIVLHHTACDVSDTIRHFNNSNSNVSAHFTVDKDGGVLQHVSPWKRAWHAGISKDAAGREHVNDFSIGIEIVNYGNGADPYPEVQVESVKRLVEAIRKYFPIKQIVSHASIAQPPGRKNDPRSYPWDSLQDTGLTLVP